MKLHILTRCTRFQNLIFIRDSILFNEFDITWHILFDVSRLKEIPVDLLQNLQSDNIKLHFINGNGDDYLYPQCGELASKLDGWIYLLDDDNIIHEDFCSILEKSIEDNPNKEIFIVSQRVDGKDFTGLEIREAKPENTKYQGVDVGQILFHHSVFKEYQFTGHYAGDGFLIDKIYGDKPDVFFWINEVLSYYNYFENPKKPKVPKILLIDKIDRELKSYKAADYEDDSLETLSIPTDVNIEDALIKFKPDSIITISDDWRNFPNLANQPLQIRNKWITLPEVNEWTGEQAYHCAMNNILVNDTSQLISYFTPIYNTGDVLYRTYESLRNQTYNNWEWVMVNDSNDNGKTLKIAESIAAKDTRVKVYDFREKSNGIIGETKYRAAMLCNGYLLCELDHDDIITEDCTQSLYDASQKHPEVGFFYSDNAEIDNEHNSLTYQPGFAMGYGHYEDYYWNDKLYQSCIAVNINPKTIRHIVGVPNHIRTWRREVYHQIGGHNRNLSIADDYELIIRTFLHTIMMRIPKMLYLQYIHSSNSHDLSRKDIQRRVRTIMYHYNERINERFKQLGFEDYCYDENKDDPLSVESRFGVHERYVNKIYNE